MLCGRLPWSRESVQAYTHDLLLRPAEEYEREICAHAPPAWQDFFAAALARSREERTPNMLELKDGLGQAARSSPAGDDAVQPFRADMLRASARPAENAHTETLGGPATTPPPPPTPAPPTPAPSVPVIVPSALLAEHMAAFAWDAEPSDPAPLPPPRPAVGPAPAGRRRLVVLDDDETLRTLLPDLLAGPDLEVETGPWHGDAAHFAADRAPDLILVDTGALDEGAAQGLRRFAEHPRLAGVPFVLFSSADEWSLRTLARRSGAAGYLAKESLAGDVGGAVRRLLGIKGPAASV
jgi:CheY-like chemotaxis protein